MATPHATIAILSIGQMGLGIAHLLKAHNYQIITNVSNRSAASQDRAASAGIQLFNTDEELVQHADYIFSIVPPRDAVATAKRIESAMSKLPEEKELYYLDLNAISPSTVRQIHDSLSQNAPSIHFIDGGIIGGPPSPPPTSSLEKTATTTTTTPWTRPDIPLSGPNPLHTAPQSGPHLSDVLNTRYLGPSIGSASGLKCCFAALSKGFTALSLQSYTTASSLDVLEPLQEYLDMYNPGARAKAEKSIVGCTGKAYRWVEEMNQIGETFAEEGGWEGRANVFREIAGVFQGLADVVEGEEGNKGMGDLEGVVGALGGGLRKHEGK